MRSLGNTLMWVGLTVGLPGVLYAMTVKPEREQANRFPHNRTHCGVCRFYSESKSMPEMIKDKDMIVIYPGHDYDPSEASAEDN